MWLYLDHRGCVISYNYGDMDGNTDWVHYDGSLPSENLTDDHGAAIYQMFGGVVLERPSEERMKDWQPEEQERIAEAETNREPTPEERIAELETALAALLRGETA